MTEIKAIGEITEEEVALKNPGVQKEGGKTQATLLKRD